MYNRLLRHLNDKILVEEQFRFRRNITTEKATYELINEIISSLNDQVDFGREFCDFANPLCEP